MYVKEQAGRHPPPRSVEDVRASCPEFSDEFFFGGRGEICPSCEGVKVVIMRRFIVLRIWRSQRREYEILGTVLPRPNSRGDIRIIGQEERRPRTEMTKYKLIFFL